MLTNRDYDLISGTLDDALTDSERAEVESRLLRDAEFAAELNAIRRTITLVKTLPELTAPRDFRLTRAQAADIAREGAQIARRPQRTSNVGRTFFLIMNAAASFILVLVGFLALLGGSLTQQPLPTFSGVAMLDNSTNTLTPIATNGLPETFSIFSVDPLTLTLEDEPPGFSDGTADISPSPPETEFGAGGAGEEMGDTMMMSVPEATPAPDLSNTARSSLPPAPTQAMLTATDIGDEAFDTMMYEALPTGTESNMGGQAFGFNQNTARADDTMLTQAPAPVTQSTDEGVAEANATDGLTEATLATEATPKLTRADDAPQRAISPLSGLLLVIVGVSLGVVTMILRLRQP